MKIKCPKCQTAFRQTEYITKTIRKYGSFYRISDRKKVQRFYCSPCCLHFSVATLSKCYLQKKRHINHKVARQLVAGTSQRECARLLKINNKTVTRKFIFMAGLAKIKLERLNRKRPTVRELEFDDLETFEHSKCKPVSVALAVEHKSRWIVGYEVAQMPAKGLLAKTALRKYGKREDHRVQARNVLFNRIKKYITPGAIIKSDQNPHYITEIARFFPESRHLRYKSRRGAVIGQGELKKQGFDPIFSLNHTFAMSRYRMSRLIRRTWNTTKKMERLDMHFALLSLYHNLHLKPPKTTHFATG
jgi:transposase-like protein